MQSTLKGFLQKQQHPREKCWLLDAQTSQHHTPQKGERSVLAKISQHLNFRLDLEKLQKNVQIYQ